MRIPVVDVRGIPLMPCTPPKARALLKAGKARPRRNTSGLFYVQLTDEPAPPNQAPVVGVDPGGQFEGCRVVGTNETGLNLMVEAPTHVKGAVKTRRTMRRARRFRTWRRPARNQNRLMGHHRLPPSTRSRPEAKARVVAQLRRILPLSGVVVEEVQAVARPGQGGEWNAAFSPVQGGKDQLYALLRAMGVTLHLREGWQTKALRDPYALSKTKSLAQPVFASHAVDAWVLAASSSGAVSPPCQRLGYVVPARLHRRHLHRLEAASGGVRSPYGGRIHSGSAREGAVTDSKERSVCTPLARIDAGPKPGGLTSVSDSPHAAWRSWLVARTAPPGSTSKTRRRGFLPGAQARGLRRAKRMNHPALAQGAAPLSSTHATGDQHG